MIYRYEYHWADGQTVKKPIKCSAPKYIDFLMTWVQDQLDDESIFPSKIGKFLQFFFQSFRSPHKNCTASVYIARGFKMLTVLSVWQTGGVYLQSMKVTTSCDPYRWLVSCDSTQVVAFCESMPVVIFLQFYTQFL